MHPKISIAYFISSHGFGHAARSSAVINAIYEKWPFIHAELFTAVPEWFFTDSLKVPFSLHNTGIDIGMIQRSPLEIDLKATIARLEETFPIPERDIEDLAVILQDLRCRLVISDISPWGIAAAAKAALPSLLIENFTWDWIYDAYLPDAPRMAPHVEYLREIFAAAEHHIQAVPWCSTCPDACLEVPPISRKPVAGRADVRDRLGLGRQGKMVLITMGGIPDTPGFISGLAACDQHVHFVVPGPFNNIPGQGERRENVTFLPNRSSFYHPDLVNAADAVVGKTGYSTLTEAYQSGVPYGYVCRPDFPESRMLEKFIKEEMQGIPISPDEFESSAWLKNLPELLAMPVNPPTGPNGADSAADYICRFITGCYELLEIVDGHGETCGAAPRCEVHGNNNLLHRVVHVLVFDDQHRLLLQKRSRKKTVAPGKWDTSVGGHVDCGETIETAMLREMSEELGIKTVSPQFAYQYNHSNDFESELVFTYVCRFDGEPRFNPDEIDSIAFWDMTEIDENLGKNLFSDNFEHEYSLYRQWLEKNKCTRPLL